MTVYDTHEDFVRDQLNSYRSAKMHVKRLLKRAEELLPDYRGDRDKIIEALKAGIRHQIRKGALLLPKTKRFYQEKMMPNS